MSVYTNNFFGLDIGFTGIRLVQLYRRKNSFDLIAAGSLPNNIDLYTTDDPQKRAKLIATIQQLVRETAVKTHFVALALPERQVHTHFLEFPLMPSEKIEQTIRWEAESLIPIPLEDVEMDWTVIDNYEKKNSLGVFLCAAAKTKVQNLLSIVEQSGLSPILLESSLVSCSRAIGSNIQPDKPCVLLSIGHSNSEIAIIHQGVMKETRNIPLGGESLTQNLVSQLGLEWDLAEKAKINFDKIKDEVGIQIGKIVDDFNKNLSDEIKRSVQYFKEKREDIQIDQSIICGRSVLLPHFLEGIQANLPAMQVVIGNSWKSVQQSDAITRNSKGVEHGFGIALGLAMRKM